MWLPTICLSLLWVSVLPSDYDDPPYNVTRTIAPGIAAVRSALTLDWLDAEDSRQRQVVQAYQTGSSPPAGIVNTDCVMYPRPAAGKIGRLLLEMLKNLEGDDGRLIVHLVQEMVEKHILVESAVLDSEPNLESLVKIPREMLSEPYHTFPRIIGMLWLTVTDPVTVKQDGWCAIKKVRKYLATTKPRYIAKHMKYLDPILARIRYIMEEFILNVTPLSMFPTRVTRTDPFQVEPKSTPEEILHTRKPINKRKTPTTTSISTTLMTDKTPTEEYIEETTTEKSTYEEAILAETTPQETSPRETSTEEVTTEETTTTSTTTESTTSPTTTETTTIATTDTTTTTSTTTTKTTTTTTKKITTKPTILTRETPQWFNQLPTERTTNVLILQMDTVTPSLSTNHIIRKHIMAKKNRVPKNVSGHSYGTMGFQWPPVLQNVIPEPDFMAEERYMMKIQQPLRDSEEKPCKAVRPKSTDIVKRFYAIYPYFDKDHANTLFLHKMRGTVNGMSVSGDILDKEAAFFATILTPVIFLQHYRDTWCLLERFHRALHYYQISHPTEKRSSLKALQKLRDVTHKVRLFVNDLQDQELSQARYRPARADDTAEGDRSVVKYLKELIKNLG